jgi:hypothetical protein
MTTAPTPFTSFAFTATGAPTPRTMPDRLADERSVLEFGADPTATNNSRNAFQAAFDAAISENKGVFVPGGRYIIQGSPVTYNLDADFGFYCRGAGGSSVAIFGNVGSGGYVFERKLATPHNTFGVRVFENMQIFNSAGGGIRMGSTIGGAIRNCTFGCLTTGISTEDSAGNSSQAITIDTCVLQGTAIGSIGIVHGGSGALTGCDLTALDTAAILYGAGKSVSGGRCEVSRIGYQLGVDSAGTDQGLSGFDLNGLTEGVITSVDFAGTVKGFSIGPFKMTGHDSSNTYRYDPGNTQYGFRIRADKAYAGRFVACASDQHFDIAPFYVEDYTTRAFVVVRSSQITVGGGTGVPWRISTPVAGFRFVDSNIDASQNAPSGTRYAFSGLPGSGVRQEGDIVDIYDGNTATVGNNVTAGGGANRVRIRWNGSNWVCIGG